MGSQYQTFRVVNDLLDRFAGHAVICFIHRILLRGLGNTGASAGYIDLYR
jgi:hypothetical protein